MSIIGGYGPLATVHGVEFRGEFIFKEHWQTKKLCKPEFSTGLNLCPTQDFRDFVVAKVFFSPAHVNSENFMQYE